MAIAYRSSASAYVASSNTLLCNKPTGTVDGDIMIAALHTNAGTSAITPPSGWTLIGTAAADASFTADVNVYWKRASSEGTDYTWTWTNTARTSLAISSYSGCVASGSPIETDVNTANDDTTDWSAMTHNVPGIVTTVANTMAIYVYGGDSSTYYATSSMSAGWTQRVKTATASEIVMYDKAFATATTTEDPSYVTAAAIYAGNVLFALKPPTAPEVVYRSSAFTNTASNTTMTCNKPTGTVDGDIMIAILHLNSGFSAIQVPSGWTLIASTGANASFSADIYAYWKRASSEGTNYTWTWTTSVRGSLGIASYSGCVASGSPIEADVNTEIDDATDFSALTHNVPAITTLTAGTKAIYVYGGDASVGRAATSMTAGWDLRIKTDTGSEVVVYDKSYTTASTTDAPSYVTASITTYGGNLLFALKSVNANTQQFFFFFY